MLIIAYSFPPSPALIDFNFLYRHAFVLLVLAMDSSSKTEEVLNPAESIPGSCSQSRIAIPTSVTVPEAQDYN